LSRKEIRQILGGGSGREILPQHHGAQVIGLEHRVERHALLGPAPRRLALSIQFGWLGGTAVTQQVGEDPDVVRDDGGHLAVQLLGRKPGIEGDLGQQPGEDVRHQPGHPRGDQPAQVSATDAEGLVCRHKIGLRKSS
jgi:hypothetical protein